MPYIRDDADRLVSVQWFDRGGTRHEQGIWVEAFNRNLDTEVRFELGSEHSDLTALAAELSKIPGFTASYTQPKVRREVPKGIGAQVALDDHIILTRVNSDTTNSWVQNSGDIAVWYDDSGIDYYLNHTLTYDTKIISKGVES